MIDLLDSKVLKLFSVINFTDFCMQLFAHHSCEVWDLCLCAVMGMQLAIADSPRLWCWKDFISLVMNCIMHRRDWLWASKQFSVYFHWQLEGWHASNPYSTKPDTPSGKATSIWSPMPQFRLCSSWLNAFSLWYLQSVTGELDFVQGCSLQNTESAVGVVVFTGHETKVGFFMQLCIKITTREHKGWLMHPSR
jgi:hypothetical protein